MFRRWDTFLPLFELLVSFLQMSALGTASTDILLSLPMLLLESSSESLASCCMLGCTFPTNHCDLTNLTLFPLPSLSEDLSGDVAGFDVNSCSCMKWAFLSSADAKIFWVMGTTWPHEPKSGDVTHFVNVVDHLGFPQVCVDNQQHFVEKTML